jgi:LCP family protein required for cell wall assembly
MKFNSVHAYAGPEYGVEFCVKQLEELFGIQIPYYVKVDLAAFRDVVDAIGGVEFDVPQRMYYKDPGQKLNIDLYPGLQTLDGEQAEGLVRYRKSDPLKPISPGYAMGDLHRVEIQQEFLKAFISQAMRKEALLKDPLALAQTVASYVKTNFTAIDAGKYLPSLLKLTSSGMYARTMPYKVVAGNTEFVYADEAALKLLTDEIFYGVKPAPEPSGDPEETEKP